MSSDVTERLAWALYEAGIVGHRRTDPDSPAAALLPVVEELRREAAAEGYERGRRDFQFEPSGDNHHNALLCPYCSSDRAAALRAQR